MLNEVIDRILGVGSPPEPATAVAASIGAEGLREAAIIHLAALLDAIPSSINGDEIEIGGLRLCLEPSEDPEAPIRYDDVRAGFAAEGAAISRRDGPRTLSSLLELFTLARDGADVIYFMPPALRSERIAAIVAQTGASERFVRFVVAHFEKLSAKVSS